MIVLLDTSHNLDTCAAELGAPVEQLLTPLTRFKAQKPEAHFAIDNGCFSSFDRASFESLLEREKERRHLCRFVTCPDVVGSARRTLEVFRVWEGRLAGWKRALVAQDGLEDLEIPWHQMDAVFIGGSTAWKMSQSAVAVIKAAKLLDKWVHVGRVNTPGRFEYFEAQGADSIDGSGLARYSWMRERIYRESIQSNMFSDGGEPPKEGE